MTVLDVLVLGAGPAGMAAATDCARAGLSVRLIDEQPAPGGQIYRGVETADAAALARLGPDYARGLELVRALRSSGATFTGEATVWHVDAARRVSFSRQGGSEQLAARALVIATGAIERPVPVPGWTLPGVMTAGGLQILLKRGLAAEAAVLAGSGPLLLLLATQLVRAGYPPRAVIELMPSGRHRQAWPRLAAPIAAGGGGLGKGLGMLLALRRAGIPVHRHATDLRIEGAERAEAARFRHGEREIRIPATIIGLHQGVIPNSQVARLLGLAHDWAERPHCFLPRLDQFGETEAEGIFLAGDGAGIGGAVAAAWQGRLAALAIIRRHGGTTTRGEAEIRRALRREARIRPLLETLYAPSPEIALPRDETIVCRCEEVSAGAVRAAARDGVTGPNQVKAFLRCGMGPCQGRVCGPTVSSLIAAERGVSTDEVGAYRVRPPLKPLRLAELAAVAADAAETVDQPVDTHAKETTQ